jgi:cytidylate kinase
MSPLASDGLAATQDVDPVLPGGLTDEAADFRDEAEQIMRSALADGAVILGRAGAAAFCDRRDVLRVRLFGRPEARQVQAATVEGVDVETARKRMRGVDSARDQYVRRLYRVSVDDPRLFHLQLDSTVIALDACADLIVAAYRAFISRPSGP